MTGEVGFWVLWKKRNISKFSQTTPSQRGFYILHPHKTRLPSENPFLPILHTLFLKKKVNIFIFYLN